MAVATLAFPDYATARAAAGFGWSAAGAQGAMRQLSGVPIQEFNLNPTACAAAYRIGRPRLREMFGPEVAIPGICTPAVSYGHANCLGSSLSFPEGGEVAHDHPYGSLTEARAAVTRPVDFASAGCAPFYLDFREQLRAAFPGEPVGFGFGMEGPITSAYELRGEGFFTDIYDQPAEAVAFLAELTDSIVDYRRWTASLDGQTLPSPSGTGMCDDLSSFIPAARWPELVLPAWERYYRGCTTGPRSVHVEDLRAAQLPHLEAAGINRYDPSISGKLNPRIIAQSCRVPFVWRLGAFHYRSMTLTDVADFVYQAAADGASGVITVIEEIMCNESTAAKVRAFVAAAKEAKALLSAGASRAELGERVTPANRARYWDDWWR
ncbi:MAG: hypothetical protein HUU35_01690 [Armatimonadetes bacterium]|nr:hypothetical protein [Armatimonadota bacterium]